MQDLNQLPGEVAWLAFALALVFGAIANWANFCTMGAITDVVHVGDWRRMRMWLLAIAVAIAGATLLESTATVDLSKTIYTTAKVSWLSHIVGGLSFGPAQYRGSARRWRCLGQAWSAARDRGDFRALGTGQP